MTDWRQWLFDWRTARYPLSMAYREEREALDAILSRLDVIELRMARLELLMEKKNGNVG